MNPTKVVRLLGCLLVMAACGHSRSEQPDAAAIADVDAGGLPPGYDEWVRICGKHYGDLVSGKFCASELPPHLTSLADLDQLLDMQFNNTAESLTGLSTGVGLRIVTPLNPRAILMRDESPDQHFEVLSFARGEPIVELIGNDPVAQTLRFFVVRFQPRCESGPAGCDSADLLTPTIEFDWTGYTLLDEEALTNTPLDCNTCHQPDGPGTRKILRMQERLQPWTHWLNGSGNGIQMFLETHAGEPTYAGFSTQDIQLRSPDTLEGFLANYGFAAQPNEFDGFAIADELAGSGTSATWQGLYENAVTGQAIPPPYFGPDQTDPAKATALKDAYRAVIAGSLPRDQLPDTRSTFLESALPAMSIRPKPGLDGRGILVHMCSQCHNSRLDQTLTRARFNVMTLDAMSRQERDTAIARLQLPDDDPLKMPPPRFRTLAADEQSLVIDELSKQPGPPVAAIVR